MKSEKRLIEIAGATSGVKQAQMIASEEVETAPWVRLKCQFGCGGFGQSLVCPPYTPTSKQMRSILNSYHRVLLIHFEPQADIKIAIAQIEREIFLAGAWKAIGLGGGTCSFCPECFGLKGQCKYPEKARPGLEACGIDVFSTVKKFGLPIEVLTSFEKCPNYYGLVLID